MTGPSLCIGVFLLSSLLATERLRADEWWAWTSVEFWRADRAKAWLFAGSSRGGDRAAFMYSLIVTTKMNDIDPQAWLADVLARMPALTVSRLPELLPWNWHDPSPKQKAA